MKKLLSVLLLGMTLALGLNFAKVSAEDDVIQVYPYDDINCSLESSLCQGALVGRSNWTLEYNGFNYHFVRGSMRYGHELVDENADGVIDQTEVVALTYNAFGTLTINNTDSKIVLKQGDRTGLTTVQHRIYAHFDENGVLQMLENQIHQYYIIDDNHGVEDADPDWRLATDLEIAAYEAADPKPANMRYAHLRMKRVDESVDPDGYLLEPLRYIQWINADYVAAAGEDPAIGKPSTILDYDPNEVHIPAGWNIMTFSTHDRGSYEPALNMVLSLPYTFLEATDPAVVRYNEIPAVHNNFTALDDNPYIDGIQIVADFGEPFVLDTSEVSATWTDMFDENGVLVNKINQKIPYQLIIKDGDDVLETLDFQLDGSGDYIPVPVTKVETDEFEKVYNIEMKSVTPEGKERVSEGIIVVGVLPNRFKGVENKFYNDGFYIDLLDGIEAFNGNDVDITDAIKVSWSAGFNPYNPQPGVYTITLSVAYEHHWPAVLTDDAKTGFKVEFKNPDTNAVRETHVVRYPSKYNVEFNKEASALLVYIDYEHRDLVAKARGFGWGTVAGVVKDGVLVHTWNGFSSYTETFPDGSTVAHADGGKMQESIQAYEMQEGEYMLFAHGTAEGQGLRTWGDLVELTGRPDIYYTAVAPASYKVTVDDRTAPRAWVINPDYRVDNTMFDSADEAIMANVSAVDNFSEVVIIVADDGGLDLDVPGTYTVSVDVEDQAANYTSLTFDVTVLEPKLSSVEVADLLAAQKATLQALIDQQQLALDALEDLMGEQEDSFAAIVAQLEDAIAGLETTVDDEKASKAEVTSALNKALEALEAAQKAQKAADDNAKDIEDKPSGTPVWLTVVLSVLSAGVAFGAAFVVLGKKK